MFVLSSRIRAAVEKETDDGLDGGTVKGCAPTFRFGAHVRAPVKKETDD